MKNSYFKKVLFIILLISVSIGTNAQKFINYTSADGLVEGIIYSIVEDHNNNFWFGTWYNPDGVSGLGKFDGLNWSQFTTTDGIVSDKVWELFEDSNNNLWVGSFESGLSKFDGDSWTTYTTADGLAGNSLSSIIEDSDGNLWFGTRDGGVSKFDGLTWTNYTTTEGLISNNVGSIIQDSEGNFWFGTLDAGVSKFDGTTWTNYTTDDGLASNQVYAMMEGNNNEFWFGNYANAGLSQFNAASNTWKIFTTDDGLLENRHRAMLKDNHGNLWFGGNAGVNMFDGENLFSYTTVDGMLDHRIREITQDSQDRIWFGTWSGVSVLDMNLVPIPDQNFEQALIDLEIDTNGLTGDILRVDAENATELLLNFPLLPNGNVNPFADPRVTITEKIQDLSGIEAFVNVTLLGLGYNSLTDIDLSNNTKLDDLFLSDNLLTSIDISQNILLKRFGVMRNPGMTGLDVSNNLVLEELFIDNTAISSIDVSTNINLWKFYGRWSNLTGIDLSKNSNLADVRVRGSASLSYMNVKNGNNTNVTGFDIRDTSLVCITADGTTVSDVSQLMLDYSAGLLNTDCGTVYIPDPNFEQALIDLGIDSDGVINATISRSDAENTTEINANFPTYPDGRANQFADPRVTITEKIQDLSGIEAFINLNILKVEFNALTAIDVSKNTQLKDLIMGGNSVSVLDVSSNSLLEYLNCNNNPMSSLDVSQNLKLDELSLDNLQFTEIDLSQNLLLQAFYASNISNLSSIDFSKNTALTNLLITGSQLETLDLSINSSLSFLFLPDNLQLTNLDLRNGGNSNLFSFLIYNTPNLTCINADAIISQSMIDSGKSFSEDCFVYIPDPNFEQALIDLGIDSDGVINQSLLRSDAELVTELNVNNKGITDLTGIEAFTNLSVFYCQYNELQDLDITNNIVLTVLECEGNQLTKLDVTQNPQLRVLGFGPNNLTEIDVSQNPLLEAFWSNGNNISTLNLDANTKLKVYGLSDNPLTYVSLKNGNNANVVYFVANNTESLDCINSDAVVSSAMSSSGKTFSEDCSTSVAGRWIIAPEPGALKVGPEPNSDLWWGLNKYQDDIAVRGCYLDDIYEFGADGSFKNVLGDETFLEPFQGVASGQCGVPVAPHDGSSSATYIYDQITGKLILNGKGAFIGLPKVVNGTELSDPNAAPESIIYNVSFSENGNAMTLIIESSSGVFFTFKLIKEAVYIPDANFEQALIDLNIDSDGEINKRILRSDTEAATGHLGISNRGIADLTGIDAFINITELQAGDNNLTSIDVSQNVHLQKIWVYFNQLSELDLSANLEMQRVSAAGNQLTTVNLNGLENVNTVYIASNNIISLDLSSNIMLSNLALNLNPIEHLDVRNGNNVNMAYFYLVDTPSLTCINTDSTISQIMIDSDKSFSEDCGDFVYIPDPNFEQALIDLGVDSDGVVNTSILREDAEAVTGQLGVSGKEITDLTGIDAFINITELQAGDNQLTSIDVSQNVLLEKIWVYYNQLTELDLSANTKMQRISAGGNQLTTVNFSNLPDVHTIYIWQNQLNSIDVSGLPMLDRFDASENLIRSIDISNNTQLTWLRIFNNQLTQLDISLNQQLNWLEAQYNPGLKLITVPLTGSPNLITLDLSGTGLSNFNPTLYPNLESLWLNENSISKINTNNILNLKALVMNDNQLSTLDLSSNTLIQRIQLNNNLLTDLDMRNGNNLAVVEFKTTGNMLTCISVDNPDDNTIPYNTWELDAGVVFSLDCKGEPDVVLIPDTNFEAALIVAGFDTNGMNGNILLSEAEAIVNLDVSGSSILDLTGIEAFVNLTDLNVSNNGLETINLTNNTNLVNVDVSANSLSECLIYSGKKLLSLNTSNNPILSLDLSSFTNLEYLDVNANLLGELDLRNNLLLAFMKASTNPNLLCIGVNDVNNIPLTGWTKDPFADYSNDPDCVAPTIVSQPVTINLDGKGQATVDAGAFDNGSTDNVTAPGNLIFEVSQSDFDCSHLGSNTIELMVYDEAGNVNSTSVILNVADNIPPSVTAINPFTYDLNGDSIYSIIADELVKASDDNCGIDTFNVDQAVFNSPGTYLITLTATDGSGNSATDTVEITIEDSGSSKNLKFKKNLELTIFPVPFTDVINIYFSKPTDLNTVSATLFDISMNPIGILFTSNNGYLVSNYTGSLPTGTYILQVIVNGEAKSTQILKK